MDEQGMEWQPAARLRDLAAVSEIERDIMAVGRAAVPCHACYSTFKRV